MQGRIVTFIKNLIKTLKNELKGPVINEKILNIQESNVLKKEVGRDAKIENKDIISKVVITDLEDRTKPEIKELTLKKSCNNILFFNKNINIENNEIKFNKIEVEVLKKSVEKSKTDIKKIVIESNKKKYEVKKSKEVTTAVINGNSKIFKIPQKIKGKKADDFYKSEYEILLKKIALWAAKNKIKESKDIEPEYIFQKIPVQCIKNIKYDASTGWAELFFDEKNSGEKTMDFAIVLNKNTGIREKIFI